ncbi:MAG: type II toxin-antitoxin system HicB family antitoxin [Bacteroidota bacterium]
MRKIEAIIERSTEGTCTIYCKNDMFSGVGKSPEEAKADMLLQMNFFKETAIEKSFSYPAFLDGEFEVVYKFDTESLLQYYAGVITPAALERLSGIHQKQLWNYLHDCSKPREKGNLKKG